MGRLVVSVSKHYTAVIDGVIHDTHDPQREGETIFGHVKEVDPDGKEWWRCNQPIGRTGGRCVYGYWVRA